MEAFFVSVLLVVAGVFWWHRTAAQKKIQVPPAVTRAPRSGYHCVEVKTGNYACEAAAKLGEVRFLPNEAPTLPLPGCSAPKCACSFVHYDDRRDDIRRGTYGEWASIPPEEEGERRARSERRKSPDSVIKPTMGR
ncbi:MAG: hypothetical protein Q8K52_02185 [Thiobacillus sp.]|nr:hypothetical protein [Thiobacillus sp.]